MATLIIIYDPAKEMATFIDAESQMGFGPAMIGPDCYEALEAFVLAMPFDLGALPPDQVKSLFDQFIETAAKGATEAPSAPADSPVESPGDPGLDGGEALADREAADASDTPAPAPADTDPEAASPPPVTVVTCVACNGEGTIDLGDGNPPVVCNMCQGTKVIAQRA